MRCLRLHPQIVLCFILGVLFAGCVATPSQPTRFYMLSPQGESKDVPPSETSESCVVIGVGPVEIAEYLNRPQIVTRISNNELNLAEFDRWAEPLVDTFSRVLSENLAKLLCTDPIVVFPSRGSIPIDYKVEVEVIHFHGTLGEEVTLITRWAVFGKNGELLLMRRSRYIASAPGKEYDELAAAMSKTIADFSENVASAIKTILTK